MQINFPHLSRSSFLFITLTGLSASSFPYPFNPLLLSLLLLTYLLLHFLHTLQQQHRIMGSLNKPTTVDGVDGKVVDTTAPSTLSLRPYHVLLRFFAFALTLIATFVIGVDKETKTISFYAGLRLQATAHWKYMSAFVYFLVSNAIACSYGAASLLITEVEARRTNGGSNSRLRLAVTTCDLVITALLFSADGAAAAVGVIGQKGNKHLNWMKVCDEFNAYCRHMTTAVVLSLVGSTAFLGLVALSAFRPH